MFALPIWEPWVELCFAIFILCWFSLLFALIASSQLHCVIRALLCTNAISMLLVQMGQLLLSLWCIEGGRSIGSDEFHFFAPIMVHQSGYHMCACTFLLITCERLWLCYKPNFYEVHRVNFASALLIALVVEMSITIPVVIALQYDAWKLVCAIFVGAQVLTSFLLLITCYRKSSLYYSTKFASFSLNCRYQVKEVIELTFVFIPIIGISLSVKMFMLLMTIMCVYGDDDISSDAHFLLRLACTLYGIFMPIFLVLSMKTLRRRLGAVFPAFGNSSAIITVQEAKNAEDITRQYFKELKKQWQ